MFAVSGGFSSIVLIVALPVGLLVIFVGVHRLTKRVSVRAENRRIESGPTTTQPATEISRAGIALGFAGAALMTIAVFLPRVGSHTFSQVEENSLIQTGGGWIFLVLAAVVTAAAYRALEQSVKGRAVLIAGVLAIAYAVYDGTGDRLKLVSANSNPFAPQISEKADPGIGIYAAGVGGAVAALGGAWILGWGIGPGGGQLPRGRPLKQCPDCAERILADARVCKHCGYRFASEEPTNQQT